MSPFVSVVVPTYNRRDSLRMTLEGLARQTYPATAFEVIVVSDGATDGTEEMLAEVASALPYALRWFAQANGGPSRARNRGIREAQGTVVVFIDDDVEPSPELLTSHAAWHTANCAVAVIGPMLPDTARKAAEPVWIGWEHAMLEKQYTAWRNGEWNGVGAHHFYSGNASVRRNHLTEVGGFDEGFDRQEDVELAVRLETKCGVQFRYDSGAIGTHRPVRTWASWLKVPGAYGSLDVKRARAGDWQTWERIRHGYHARNRATRLLADISLSLPGIGDLLRGMLLGGAQCAYRLGRANVAFAALSAIYNVRYLESAARALGSARALRGVLRGAADTDQGKAVAA